MSIAPAAGAKPLCPVFGICGGCAYQDLPYEEELRLKAQNLKSLLQDLLKLEDRAFGPVVPSPEPYHYRSRLDLTLKRSRTGEPQLGFQLAGTHRMIETGSCAIARREISDFIPELKRLASAKLPENYDLANLTVRTGDGGKVFWGGIGRRSLEMKEEDYFWTEIRGRRIFYSLETFFQANLSILPSLIETIRAFGVLDRQTRFLDLYAGVGLFGFSFSEEVKRVTLIEESKASLKLARFNAAYHRFENLEIVEGKVELHLAEMAPALAGEKTVAMIDPPRKGLSGAVRESLAAMKNLSALIYLSCGPETLARDLEFFRDSGWKITQVIPFDFFPKTAHLETLVLLTP